MSAKKAKPSTVPVTERAQIQRINRKLRKEGEVLKTTGGMRAFQDIGRHYILDTSRNVCVGKHFDLEDLGRELEVLAHYEHLAQDA